MIKNTAFIKRIVSNAILTPKEAEVLYEERQKDAYAIAVHLVEMGKVEKDVLGKLWADSIGHSYVNLEKTILQENLSNLFNEKFAITNSVVPVCQFGKAVTVAFANPTDAATVTNVERVAKCPITPVFAFKADIEDAIGRIFKAADSTRKMGRRSLIANLLEINGMITAAKLQSLAGDQAVTELVQNIILFCFLERGSDMHIEPGQKEIRIRFRIDGVLQDKFRFEPALLLPLSSSFKMLADLDIAERRKPQDGRISLTLSKHAVDIRFSSVPTIYGEKIVLRILSQNTLHVIPDLSDLELSHGADQQIKRILRMPNGVFIASGPTGSGKTTTLFSMLQALNTPDVNIVTIEDPVEYRLEGVSQCSVNLAIDFDFEKALRHFLRQDPDIILIGEIRDLETARIAVKAALTGHLVLSTTHTKNAFEVITRLLDIGVEPFQVVSSINGVMAQRLVRRICPECKEKYLLPTVEAEKYFTWDGQKDIWFHRGKGCNHCNQTGYLGRLGIYEIFVLNDEVRQLISQSASIDTIKSCAKKHGFKPMFYDGLKKVLRGITTLAEINRVGIEEG